jgi:hypothetical protein
MEPKSSGQPREPIVLAYHLVAFVDLLGQGDELDKLTSLPRTEAAREQVKDVLRRTAGRVLAIRDGFDNMFQRFSALLKDGSRGGTG